ncbi:MAG: hypothetical protein DI549_10765 [Ancylobacter novellus]|uniref:Tip attachment protein J HDII-ins2 domain-containing protein n=1 Tax=Ancylobacter novellus TaxID=921 RepID=A0A2W5R6X8_ANCNO|nr:MAG: hypothetical protein DI549_10765 [Ancylobacter novellus]
MTSLAIEPVRHVLLPGRELACLAPRPRESINGFLKRAGWRLNDVPTICLVNNEPVLRADWTRRIRKRDTVVFVSRPRGGSTSTRSLIGLVGMIAIAALAPGIGSAAAAALGFGTTGFASSAIATGVAVAGAAAIGVLTATKPGGQSADPDPVYAFGSTGNTARLLQTIPCSYGRIIKAPDYATRPWAEFDGDQQYLHLLFVNGVGRYRRDQILVADTVLWDRVTGVNPAFSGVELQFREPGEPVTLFPTRVETSSEVSGQELSTTFAGGFVANAAGTLAKTLAIDFVLPEGLYSIDSQGDMRPHSVVLEAQYRAVDAAGAPAGGWVGIPSLGWTRCTRTPVRLSIRADVSPGRYEVRVRRLLPPTTNGKAGDKVMWAGLRAFIDAPASFANVSVTALRLKATDQLSGDAARDINFIDTRILPVWNGTGWVDQPTRRPAWAALDLATNAVYGGARALSKVDLQAFVDLAASNEARDETFDFTFTSGELCLDQLDQILATARAKTRWLGDTLSLVREQWASIPSMLLTDREIVRDSFSLKYDLLPSTAYDGLVLEYVDETTWKPAEIISPRGTSPSRPLRKQLPGITRRAHAQLEADFLWRCYLYRRRRVLLSTEHDGRLLSVGSSIAVQSDMPDNWGASAEVARREGNGLILSDPVTWGTGQHYVRVRTRTGGSFGPIKCARGAADHIALLDAPDLAAVEATQGPLNAALARADGGEGASAAVGLGTTWQRRCLVTSGAPSGDQVALEMLLDDPRVHDEDLTAPPPLPTNSWQTTPRLPVIGGLVARIRPSEHPPTLDASWFPAAGAASYMTRISYDEGASYTPLGEVRAPYLTAVVEAAAAWFEVAGINLQGRPGGWARTVIAAPVRGADNITVTKEMFEAGVRDYVLREVKDVQRVTAKAIEDINRLLAEVDAQSYTDRQVLLRDLTSTVGQSTARVLEKLEVATGPESALAQAILTVEASVGALDASVTDRITAAVGPGSAVAEAITELEAAIGNVEASLKVRFVAGAVPSGALSAWYLEAEVSDGVGTARAAMRVLARLIGGEAVSEIQMDASRFSIGLMESGVFNPMFIVNTTTGVVSINMNLIANGSITALLLNVSTLQAISANLGTIIAGILRSADNKFVINLDAGYQVVRS